MTTRARAKSVVVGVVPPNSPTSIWSYSNGRLIHFLEALVGNCLAVDRHNAASEGEYRHSARGQQSWRGRSERARQQRQRDRGVGLHRDLGGIGGQFSPALRLFEARAGRAAEVRHV